MAKIHDLFIVELAEVIKGYGNDPDNADPFRLSEFYRFYELPNIAVSRENFEKMQPVGLGQKDTIQKFHDYQVEWLKSHYDIELEPQLEEMIIRFLHDTANCYMMEIDREEGGQE